MENMIYSAVIFDLDGTLIESNSVWEKLDKIILDNHNITYSDKFLHSLAAMTYEEAADEFQKIGLNMTAKQFSEEINRLAAYEYANNIHLKEYAAEYIAFLKKNNIKIALATASPEFLYAPVLKNNGIYDSFDAFVTTDEVGKSKDFPDVYLMAAQKLSADIRNTVVFEDTAKGIISAKKAGFITIGVYDEYSSEKETYIDNILDKFIHSFKEML